MQYLAILACFFLIIPNLFSQSEAKEPRLSHVRQLTFGGDNAEAYFSFDGKRLSFQSNNPAWGLQCDQIFAMDISAAADAPSYRPPLISTGLGRTTCAYFMPDDKHILYASTHEGGTECPPPPPERTDRKYLWQIFSTFDIYVADLQGKIVKKTYQ